MYEFDGTADSARSLSTNVEFTSGIITTQLEQELESHPLSETKVGKPLYNAAVLRLLEKINHHTLGWFERKLESGKDTHSHDAEDLETWQRVRRPLPYLITEP